MTTPRPKRSGFLANLQAAMTPVAAEPDDPSKPLVTPGGVKAAVLLALLGGLLYMFTAVASLVSLDQQITEAVANYNTAYATQVTECQEKVGGIGDQVTATPGEGLQDLANTCKQVRQLTQADIDGARQSAIVTSIVVLVVGLAAVVAGWFLRSGVKWARLTVMGVVVLAFIGTLMLGISSPLLLIGTLLLAVALMLTFLGKGSLFFQRAAARRAGGAASGA
jgi:hypothetical protein